MTQRTCLRSAASLAVLIVALFWAQNSSASSVMEYLDEKKAALEEWWHGWVEQQKGRAVTVFRKQIDELTDEQLETARQEITAVTESKIRAARESMDGELAKVEAQLAQVEERGAQLRRELAAFDKRQAKLEAVSAQLAARLACQERQMARVNMVWRILYVIAILAFLRVFGPGLYRVVAAKVLRGRVFQARKVLG